MKGLTLSAALIVIVIGLVGSFSFEELLAPAAEESAADDAPAWYFSDFTMRVMNTVGTAEYVLKGVQLVGFEGEVEATVEAPELVLRSPRDAVWRVRADNGEISDDGKMLRLRGNVTMLRKSPMEEDLHIEGQQIDVDTRERVARGSGDMLLRGNGWQVSSPRLLANYGADRIELDGGVRARYQPEPVL